MVATLLLSANLNSAPFDSHAAETYENPAHFTIAVEPSEGEFDIDHQDVRSISISPNGKVLAAGGHDETLRIWDMETCKLLKTIRLKFTGPEDKWHPSDVMAVAFSPDGKHLAAGSRDWAVRIWELNPIPTAKESQKLVASHAGGIRSIAYSSDGTYLAVGGHEKIIHLWRMGESPSEVGTLTGHPGIGRYGVNSLAFGPMGRTLLSGGSDGTVRLWDIDIMTQIGQFEALKEVLGVAFSPDGKFVAAAATGYDENQDFVLIWALESGKQIHKLRVPETPWAVSFSPNGKLLAANGNWPSTLLWDTRTGKVNQKLIEGRDGGGLRAITFIPDGQFLVTGGWGQTPHLWNAGTGELVKVFRKTGCTP